MPRFEDFLRDIQVRTGFPHMDLIHAWTPDEIQSVETAMRAAVAASGIIGSTIPDFTGTNQSKGNKAATHLIRVLPPYLPTPNKIIPAKGDGYPDQIFVVGELGFCMELKATSNWQDGDSNRRVLTSSPKKLRELISTGKLRAAPAHLVCTVHYSEGNSTVDRIRLDFLEPDSEVSIRLEASTSQRLLSRGPHHKVVLP